MIKIIKPGINDFKMRCNKCECIFTYSMEDLKKNSDDTDTVDCPCCGESSYHNWREVPYEPGEVHAESVEVTPEKKCGHWDTSYEPFKQAAAIKCSECGFFTYYEGQTTFPHECPECGAVMEDDI